MFNVPNHIVSACILKNNKICCVNNNNELPVFSITVKDRKFRTLYDTGATISLLSARAFEEIRDLIKVNYLSRQVKITTLSGEAIPFKQVVSIPFKIDGKFFRHIFYVTLNDWDTSYKVLVGVDFIRSNNLMVDLFNAKLVMNNHNATLNLERVNEDVSCNNLISRINGNHKFNSNIYKQSSKQEIHEQQPSKDDQEFNNWAIEERIYTYAKAYDKYKIPPKTIKWIKLKMHDEVKPQEQVLVCPMKRFANNIEINISRADADNCINIPFENFSDEFMNINKNAWVVHVENGFVIEENVNNNAEIVNNIKGVQTQDMQDLRKQEFNLKNFNLDHLSKENKAIAQQTLKNNFDVFSASYKTLGVSDTVKPRIKLLHKFPIQTKPYKLPHMMKGPARKEIEQLVEAGLIEESTSPYAFPVIFVKKKQSNNKEIKLRMAVDYRVLNSITENFSYPIGSIQDILQNVAGKQVYCVLDLKSAFFQIKLHPEDRHKLAFTTEFGNWQPLRVPFGLCLSSAYFTKLMDKVLGDLKHMNIHFFLDDIIIAADTFEDANNKLKLVFDRLRLHNLTLDPLKLQLFQDNIDYLGYCINKEGYCPSQKNIQKITKFPQNTTLSYLRVVFL